MEPGCTATDAAVVQLVQRRNMRPLWIGFLVLAVTLGSTYPYNFDTSAATPEAWKDLWASWGWRTSLSDMFGNFLLFLPAGIFGMMTHNRGPWMVRAVTVAAIAFLFAVSAQVAQIYLPTRNATMADVTWNMAGLAPGLLFFLVPWQRMARGLGLYLDLCVVPWLLIAAWLVYFLMPFVPSLDLQPILDSLDDLLLHPTLEIDRTLLDAASWIAIAYLMKIGERGGQLDLLLPVVIVACLLGKIIIIFNDLTLANVLGALIATILWFGLIRRLRFQSAVVSFVLLLHVGVGGLMPFTFMETAKPFSWYPFGGLLVGSMPVSAAAVTQKIFVYGSLVFTLGRAISSTVLAAGIAAIVLFAVEWTQRYLPGRTPEITDILLVVVATLTIVAVRRSYPRLVLGTSTTSAPGQDPTQSQIGPLAERPCVPE